MFAGKKSAQAKQINQRIAALPGMPGAVAFRRADILPNLVLPVHPAADGEVAQRGRRPGGEQLDAGARLGGVDRIAVAIFRHVARSAERHLQVVGYRAVDLKLHPFAHRAMRGEVSVFLGTGNKEAGALSHIVLLNAEHRHGRGNAAVQPVRLHARLVVFTGDRRKVAAVDIAISLRIEDRGVAGVGGLSLFFIFSFSNAHATNKL